MLVIVLVCSLLSCFFFLKDSKTDESSTPPTSPKTELAPPLPPVEVTSDDAEIITVEDAEELEVEEAVFSDEENDQKEENSSKSKFKPIEREEEPAKVDDTIRSVDVVELEDFQNIDNTLLRDNILKLKNDR